MRSIATAGGGTAIVGNSIGGDQGGYGGIGVEGRAAAGGTGLQGTATDVDRDGLGGIGALGTSEGGIGVAGFASGADQEGPGVGVEGFGPIGVSGITEDPMGFAFRAVGPVTQDADSSGWMKAACYLSGSPTKQIARAFNSQLPGGGVGVVNAGMTLTRIDRGVYVVDFGFQVNNRWVTAAPEALPSGTDPTNPNSRIPGFDPIKQNFVIANTYAIDVTKVLVITWTPQGAFVGGGQPVFQGFLPTEANVTVMVF